MGKSRTASKWVIGENDPVVELLAYTQSELEAAVLAEREACAKVCEALELQKVFISPWQCAAAIRSRCSHESKENLS